MRFSSPGLDLLEPTTNVAGMRLGPCYPHIHYFIQISWVYDFITFVISSSSQPAIQWYVILKKEHLTTHLQLSYITCLTLTMNHEAHFNLLKAYHQSRRLISLIHSGLQRDLRKRKVWPHGTRSWEQVLDEGEAVSRTSQLGRKRQARQHTWWRQDSRHAGQVGVWGVGDQYVILVARAGIQVYSGGSLLY